ncbi:hypothetical protein CP97_14757 [Aurantiacibacter atlanticus]|uniref:Uncharacterized protein n=1 Tax=Aurantiacibacter atlanticus TaxID=1648404 RepID=A0A168M201_9SPHN|nr:hypothetical protein CP97_14757 [Aurantiacibacter atlanticus]
MMITARPSPIYAPPRGKRSGFNNIRGNASTSPNRLRKGGGVAFSIKSIPGQDPVD